MIDLFIKPSSIASLLGAAVFVAIPHATAGGGPENLFLVVNSNSESSKTIANHYIAWRAIPPGNVFYVDWKWSVEKCPSERFRTKLLQPILETIERRGLTKQIDLVVYSSDFPWSVNYEKVFSGETIPKYRRKVLSLTGATYLWQMSLANSKMLFGLASNQYVPVVKSTNTKSGGHYFRMPSQGFRSEYRWMPGGKRAMEGGARYFLSTMLAVTSGRGTTIDEALRYLRRSVDADGTRPGGSFYFVKNNNIRSKARHHQFPAAIAELTTLGLEARLLPGKFPSKKHDVAGLMIGTATFDIDSADLRILPGAICDHFTSRGGDLTKSAAQTPLSEFLRHGAAGASGTVTEPFAIAQKFPSPFIHVHYAKGCSLAEAFYQSVAAPCQLLIVGDPLCQPWARIPAVAVEGAKAGQTVRDEIHIKVAAASPRGIPVKRVRLFVDGRLSKEQKAGIPFSIDTTMLSDGYHEFRIVAIGPTSLQCQGRKMIPVWVDNRQHTIDFTVSPNKNVGSDRKLRLAANAPGARAILFLNNRRLLGRVDGEAGEIVVDSSDLGSGPASVQAVAIGPSAVASNRVIVEIGR